MQNKENIKPLGKITVTAVVPPELSGLKDIANNLWWSWNGDAIDLYREIDLELWEALGKNPVLFLKEVSQTSLLKKIKDISYMKKYELVIQRYRAYISCTDTWFSRAYPDKESFSVAYFCAEYGVHEVVQLYSGGLGVLAGDHCKSASDLGVPLTAVGLFYKQGYFNQHLNKDGWQETKFEQLNPDNLPITPVFNDNGQQITISVEMPGRIVYASIWKIQIGRVPLYLIDADVPENSVDDRSITAKLYGGDQETRIQQEILLGIGGIQVLDTLGIHPTAYHMNEGHSAFMGLELIRQLVQNNKLSFRNAREVVSSCVTFTTHTPVPAGNDVFPVEMIDKYFGSYWNSLEINRHEFLDLGLRLGDTHNFNMTVLALTLAGRKNGVSELHGAVSRNIFKNVWPSILENDIPITHITNGIHILTWLSPSLVNLYQKYLPHNWSENLADPTVWENISNIPDEELWNIHTELKFKMIKFIREKIKIQKIANGEHVDQIRNVDSLMDPHALTIGFARRFATYKRANLIFRNLARIEKILNNISMPVQIIFAGKAHPADRPAHEVIKNINDIAQQEGFHGKVILVENYNMTLARNMIQGVDVWMNNPRRPLEASGTSGQKVCINGAINFSILDGWWCEAYNGKNGWAIGDDSFYETEELQDIADSESMYDVLENQIIPLFFYRNSRNIPVKWVELMKESIKTLAPIFNTHRMVQDYTNNMYIPSFERMQKIISSKYEFSKQLSEWKLSIERNWPQVQIFAGKNFDLASNAGDPIDISVETQLGDIDPSSVIVQLCYGRITRDGSISSPEFKEMSLGEKTGPSTYQYYTSVCINYGGDYGYTYRIIPYSPDLINKFEMGLIKWTL